MAKIIPFKAVRPTRDKVGLVASRSYETYTPQECKARLEANPYSFLHIINPGYKYQKEISGPKRFALVRNRYQEFKEDSVFVQDEQPCYYLYKIVDREHQEFTGIVAAASVEDYKNDVIKKHEDTLHPREVLFKEYLKVTGFNSEAVLLTYPDDAKLDLAFNEIMKTRAEYEFTTTYRDTHYVWPINEEETIEEIKARFEIMNTIYIADGHHRSSSSFLLSEDLKSANQSHKGTEPYNYFMAYLIPESHLRIHGFSRMVKDLNGLDKEEFLIALDEYFKIENRGHVFYQPTKKHHFSMYLDGEFYSLYLRNRFRDFKNALASLDSQILYEKVLEPILGIHDLRSDNRIAYGKGKNDMMQVKEKIDEGNFKVGFNMLPPTVDEVKAIADEGLTMPPKSTYIEPKLRSGVTIYEF